MQLPTYAQVLSCVVIGLMSGIFASKIAARLISQFAAAVNLPPLVSTLRISWCFLPLLCTIASLCLIRHFGINGQALLAFLFTWGLIVLAYIDCKQQLLPDQITLSLLGLGLIANYKGLFCDAKAAIIGAAAGYMSLWFLAWIFKKVTGKEGMGHGDFKLLAALGAWVGWMYLPFIVFMASSLGSIIGVGLILFTKHQPQQPIPFGPFLAIAGWLVLLWGNSWMQLYYFLIQ